MTKIEERIQEIRAWRSLWNEEFDFGEVKGIAEYSFYDDYFSFLVSKSKTKQENKHFI